jgi:hypothetical protein
VKFLLGTIVTGSQLNKSLASNHGFIDCSLTWSKCN